MNAMTELHQENKKFEKRETVTVIPRLMEVMHKGHERNKYW